ncbi:hypothetical protein NFI96_008979, partial [Prochilodus magdalenae]
MPDINRTLILEALSALTEAEVKPLSKHKIGSTIFDELTTNNFLSTVYGKVDQSSVTAAQASLRSLLSRLNELALDLQSEEPEEEPETEISGLRKELFVDLDKFLDPCYDYDFRRGSDSSQCSRGGEPYSRPWGWYRFALRVRNKYPDGNTWLGSAGWRSHSSPGEWPVSFHGTSIDGARGITRSHFTAGPREAYGRGIYSTPDIEVALGYTLHKTFTSSTTGKTYHVIMQNRINPGKRVITEKKDHWLIPVPQGSSAAEEKRIVEASIRPYGILIKEKPLNE